MKRLIVTFELENDISEYRLRNQMDSMNAKYMKTLPCTDHLKENKHYKALRKAEKNAQDIRLNFINENRE